MESEIRKYLQKIQAEFQTGKATEHTYRPALKELLETINPEIRALNEGQRTVKVGAPDFRILKGELELWWIETKDLHISLDDKSNKDQLQRYLDASDNLIFTNNLEFRYFKNKQLVHTVSLGKIEKNKLMIYETNLLENNIDALSNLLQDFLSYQGQLIKSSKELAVIMAGKARLLNDIILNVLNEKEDVDESLQSQYRAFKNILVHDLSYPQFSDMYAQTIVYGFFVARLHDDSLENFSREEAEKLIPKSNDFLRNLFRHIAFDLDERISWIVDSLVEIFNHCDIKKLLENHGKSTSRNDPVIHFYETFLTEYNPKLRKSRGVYYTPEPVVNFIIRAIDIILKNDFWLPQGLADTSKMDIAVKQQAFDKRTKDGLKKELKSVHRVQLLDPATGTGTFLNEVVKHIYQQFGKNNQGIWNSYVQEHLLPRIFWFELLMAPYTMAHLKLWLTLAETGYKDVQSKIWIYLSNSLEEAHDDTQTLFSSWLSAESQKASELKNNAPIMIITGNPPYSVSSTNKGEWIQNLIKDYKKDLNEKKLNLDDDYIKFIRYAQYFIDKNWEGIVAMITNNSYIDGVTHRQMRKSLMESFDKIYIYDLHGNSKKKEVCPDGSKDENVFDIMQWVSIILAVKTTSSKKHAEIYHYDARGKRDIKYSWLWEQEIDTIQRTKLTPVEPYYFFVPKDFGAQKEYDKGVKIDELFIEYNSWIQTKNDKITVQETKEDMTKVVDDFLSLSEKEIKQKYQINDWVWTCKKAKEDIVSGDYIISKVSYKPFDTKRSVHTKKSGWFIGRPREKTMKYMIKWNNFWLCLMRWLVNTPVFNTVLVTKHLLDINFYGFQTYLLPLYLYQTDLSGAEIKLPNFDMKIIDTIAQNLWLTFISEEKWNQKNTFWAEDVFDYIYAVLHSPSYREKYKEFLKIDFPRIPFTKDKSVFFQLIQYWAELRKLHLLESDQLNRNIVGYPIAGDNKVEKIHYEDDKVWINESQYFSGVPQTAWEFYIGGYQPAQKWLKDRKDRILNTDDVLHYQKMIIALVETDSLMQEIDLVKFI